ncbi:TetR/AcrR family transcriptional regulator [Cellulomonas sp. RIT-PI-Y]|uniref:TetR/AcrR family transcriptional regulator n=1 Tax=Cellulomonas sp. RIT-PI-Y TaxID=3035297 RepID=UPI0021D7D857|nr:TetR/AcrR family transcriptional regulator [Cellulomonas sp. RIT-PI-Y]
MTSRRGPYAKTRGREEAVGRVAYELVRSAGHRALTMTEVARRTELSEAQLLYLFPSRDHLLVAALVHADSRSDQAARERRPDPGTEPDASLARTINHELADPASLRLFVSMAAEAGDPEHPAHRWMTERRARITLSYATFLRRLQADGWAHPDVDPEQFARQFMALWDGLQAHWLIDPSFDLGAEVGAGLRALARRDAMLARVAINQLL